MGEIRKEHIDRSYQADVYELFEKYSDMVYRIARVQMKNTSDADDIFQETFLRLVRYGDTLESEEHAKAWLIRVTLNNCKKHFSSAWVRHTASMEAVEYTASTEPELERSDLYEAVCSLPYKQKTVIHLHYYEGYSVQEIAALTGRKEGTVKSDLHRARKELGKKLGGMEFG